MSPKAMKKFVLSTKYKQGKKRNGIFCSCLQCSKSGYKSPRYRKFKLKGE
jgi:hypothetical protein